MERLGAQSAQLEDLCAAIFTPELQSMTDIQPDASLKAQTHVGQPARSFSLLF